MRRQCVFFRVFPLHNHVRISVYSPLLIPFSSLPLVPRNPQLSHLPHSSPFPLPLSSPHHRYSLSLILPLFSPHPSPSLFLSSHPPVLAFIPHLSLPYPPCPQERVDKEGDVILERRTPGDYMSSGTARLQHRLP